MQTSSAESVQEHLLVLVHGILSGPSDWRYIEAELKRRLSNKFLIYASAANSYANTLAGIDVAGRRLAEEVQQVISKTPSLKKISFLGHSLGGLFARYAVALLFSPYKGDCKDGVDIGMPSAVQKNTIGGLMPINFITLATPHLGVRGKRQLPFLFGVPFLEKLAAPVATILAGRTGQQLFLMYEKASKPPLLLQMVTNTKDLPFISALGSFKLRACYANVGYDHMVGWRTSSIRRETELPVPPRKSLDGYKHVVSVTYCPPVCMDMPSFQPESAEEKEAAQKAPSSKVATAYHERMEEEMIRGLQQISWSKVDVSFHAALWPFLAHNHIHVKSEWLHYEGAGVVSHVADSLKGESSDVFIMANL